MIDKRDFLDAIAGYVNSPTQGPKSSADRPIRLGTVDPYYTSGQARVLFDGETVLSDRGYSWAKGYSPTPGERVYLFPVGQTFLIGGAIDNSVPYSKYHNIPLANNIQLYGSSTFHDPSFTKTVSGVVKLTGMGAHTTTTGLLANGTLLATLPEGFRPPTNMSFPAATGSTNAAGVVEVLTDGRILARNNIFGVWFSLGQVVFQTADLEWTQLGHLNMWGSGSLNPGTRALSYTKDELGRVWIRGNFGNALAPKTSDTVVFNTPTGFRPSPQGVYAAGANVVGGTGGYANTFWNTSGDFSWRTTSDGQSEVSVDGIVAPPSSASWITATMNNAWLSYGTSNTPGYFKDADGMVHLRGLAKSGAINTSIMTLPVGYRPAKNIVRIAASSSSHGRLDVRSDGTVVPVTGSNPWYSLDSVVFTAEQ